VWEQPRPLFPQGAFQQRWRSPELRRLAIVWRSKEDGIGAQHASGNPSALSRACSQTFESVITRTPV
jgi:hypothetical protein